jgi:hypothetical protein
MKKILFIALMGICFSANATEDITNHMLPSGNCDRALPVYDDGVRKRPLAVVNEGTTLRYINCTFEARVGFDIRGFGVWYKNMSNAPQNVTCTGVVGLEGEADYYTQTKAVAPGATQEFNWNGWGEWKTPVAVQCGVKAGGALTYVWVKYGH